MGIEAQKVHNCVRDQRNGTQALLEMLKHLLLTQFWLVAIASANINVMQSKYG